MKNPPKELLLHMYEHGVCSFCREDILKEMSRRRMLTEDILQEIEANRQQKRMYLHGISKEQQKEIRKGKIIMFLVVFVITVAVCIYAFF